MELINKQLYYMSLIMYTVLLTWIQLINLNIFVSSFILLSCVIYGFTKFKRYKE